MIVALVGRELAISLRRGTVHLLVVVHALLTLGLVVLAEWLVRQATPIDPPTVGSATRQSLSGLASAVAADVGVALLFGFTIWMLVLCVAVASSIGGQSVARERERGLLAMLLSTGARPATIVVAKALAVLVQSGLVLLGGLPSLAIVFVFGEVVPRILAQSALLVVAWALAIGAVSVCCSAWSRTSSSGVIATFVGAVVVMLTFLLGPAAVEELGAPVPALVYALNPFVAVLALQPELGQRLVALLPTNAWLPPSALAAASAWQAPWVFVVACLVLATSSLAVASLRLGR